MRIEWERVHHWTFIYNNGDDSITIVMEDLDGNECDSVVMTAGIFTMFQQQLNDAVADLIPGRRVFRKAEDKGVDVDVIANRFEDIETARHLDASMKAGQFS